MKRFERIRAIARLELVAVMIAGLSLVTAVTGSASAQDGSELDLTRAVLISPPGLQGPAAKAVDLLADEVTKRSFVDWPRQSEWPGDGRPAIVVGVASELAGFVGGWTDRLGEPVDLPPEGFRIWIERGSEAPTIFVAGNDARGSLYGAGYLLRKLRIGRERVTVAADLDVETAPEIPLRGHQLGYRPKTNSYDGFDAGMWEQYIRDLVVFGANAVELLPPNTDDAPDSPLFPKAQLDMMARMAEILQAYELDTWIWYPLMHGDYTEAANVEISLAENETIFRTLPKIDALFIPGGDPGQTKPDVLFDYLEQQTRLLHRYHPEAEMWVSPQGFDGEWMDEFLELVSERPAWLTGIVYGPQVRLNITRLRPLIPEEYKIRRYPDITHNFDSQYPVPNWDFAFAATEHRESINPRPRQQKAIFNTFDPDTYYGFITYSEGVNDDVNKAIWSSLGWDREADVLEILRDYSRYFIGPNYEDDFAQGLLDLEQNWDGALLGNTSVYNTHHTFQAMERRASPAVRLNWRFQMALFRSYYDAYTRARLLYETQLEDQAMSVLRTAGEVGSLAAMEQAERILECATLDRTAEDWRARLFELADALFQSIRMQKTVDRHFGIFVRRGANLALVDNPVNNRIWLMEQFDRIRAIDGGNVEADTSRSAQADRDRRREAAATERRRLAEIDKLVNWTNPGPGGYYDDLGDLGNQPHLVMEGAYASDPAFLRSPFVGFTVGESTRHWRVSWVRYAQTLYDQPLRMRYTGLDPNARYEVKVIYSGNVFDQKIRLRADDNLEVHPYMQKPLPVKPVTMDVPYDATRDGDLTLEWSLEPGVGGTGRGTQLAEVWLMKKQTPP